MADGTDAPFRDQDHERLGESGSRSFRRASHERARAADPHPAPRCPRLLSLP
jgi:hypothetical protein